MHVKGINKATKHGTIAATPNHNMDTVTQKQLMEGLQVAT